MTHKSDNLQGLTRLILESLLDVTPEVVSSGEKWSAELLDQVEKEVHQRLAPPASQTGRFIFDLVFKRSFAEAKRLILLLSAVSPSPETTPRQARGQIWA